MKRIMNTAILCGVLFLGACSVAEPKSALEFTGDFDKDFAIMEANLPKGFTKWEVARADGATVAARTYTWDDHSYTAAALLTLKPAVTDGNGATVKGTYTVFKTIRSYTPGANDIVTGLHIGAADTAGTIGTPEETVAEQQKYNVVFFDAKSFTGGNSTNPYTKASVADKKINAAAFYRIEGDTLYQYVSLQTKTAVTYNEVTKVVSVNLADATDSRPVVRSTDYKKVN